MTRKCGWCGKTLGEKCPDCGERAEKLAALGSKPIYGCERCRRIFREGAGGVTTTICTPCADKQLKERRSQRDRERRDAQRFFGDAT